MKLHFGKFASESSTHIINWVFNRAFDPVFNQVLDRVFEIVQTHSYRLSTDDQKYLNRLNGNNRQLASALGALPEDTHTDTTAGSSGNGPLSNEAHSTLFKPFELNVSDNNTGR